MIRKMRKLFAISIIVLLICLSIPNLSGRKAIQSSTSILENPDLFTEDILFNLKIRTMMRLAHLESLSTGIIKNNSLVWYNGYGFSDRLLLQRASKDTMYMAGSISKVITATALMQLYENESYDFDLDDNVSEWLPFDFKNPNFPNINITFRMLLAHQSSLHDHDKISELAYLFSNHPYSYTKELLLPNGSDYHPEYWGDYPPGAGANYSNLGFTLLGYIIERITNQSFEQYCNDNIFKPLGMKNTSFNTSNLDKSNLAAPYFWFGGIYIRMPKTDFIFYDPCGGLYTTVEDLSHILIAHLNDGIYNNVKILNNSTLDMMHTVQYPKSSPYYNLRFGLGWLIWPDINNEPYYMGHGGDLIFYHAMMLTRVSDNISIIYFYNSAAPIKILFPIISSIIRGKAMGQINKLLFEKAEDFK